MHEGNKAVLAQKSRHIVETCRAQQRRISPAKRDHVWMGAGKKEVPPVLLILYVMSVARVTSKGGIVSPGHCFNS